ncbi:MAG: tetratricopeptide repeat protein [Thermomicrobiales bacterium]
MPKYVSRVEQDFFGNDRVVTRQTVSADDVVGVGVSIASNMVHGFKQRRADEKAQLAARRMEWATQASEQGNYTGALETINQVVKDFPRESVPYFIRAQVNLDHSMEIPDDDDEHYDLIGAAIADLNAAINVDGNDLSTYAMRGNAYLAGGALDYALADANMCVKMAPDETVGYDLRCQVFSELGDYQQALTSAQRMLQIETDSNGYYTQGMVYVRMEEYEKALSDFSRAIALNGSAAGYYEARAYTYRWLGREEESKADFARADEIG